MLTCNGGKESSQIKKVDIQKMIQIQVKKDAKFTNDKTNPNLSSFHKFN
jgi:hypothetical protein